MQFLARGVVHEGPYIYNVCREVEVLTRGSRQLCAAALVQFLVRGVVQEGPYAAKWNSLLVVLDNGARAAALVDGYTRNH